VTASNSCPECGGRVETKRGEIVCSNCGLVIEDSMIDPKAESRNPALARTQRFQGITEVKGRLKKFQLGLISTNESKRARVHKILLKVKELGLPAYVLEQAEEYAVSIRLKRGLEYLVLACVLAAAKKNGIPIRYTDLEKFIPGIEVGRAEKISQLKKAYSSVIRRVGLVSHSNAQAFIERFSQLFKLNEKEKALALEAARKVTGKDPAITAAAAICYIKGLEPAFVAKQVRVSTGSVKQRLEDIQKVFKVSEDK